MKKLITLVLLLVSAFAFPQYQVNIRGNAATATTLQTARAINGVSFNGSANITITDANTPLAGDNDTSIATTAYVQTAIGTQPLVYTAFISQTGTSDPSATVLKNTLGGTVVWTRTVAGSYTATLTGVFTGNKTLVFLTNGSGATFVKGAQLTADSVNIQTFNSSAVLTDAILTNASIRIEVYP